MLKSVGIGPALIVNTVVVLIGATGLWLATGAKTTFFSASASWTLYLGGVFGFIIIAAAYMHDTGNESFSTPATILAGFPPPPVIAVQQIPTRFPEPGMAVYQPVGDNNLAYNNLIYDCPQGINCRPQRSDLEAGRCIHFQD
jgi:hypothetical protein